MYRLIVYPQVVFIHKTLIVFSQYMEELLRAGQHLEFFLEGGRTRSGKACVPKGGLLSVVVDTFIEGRN